MAILRTVHVLVDTDDWHEASDILSGLLSETGMYPSKNGDGSESPAGLLDWGYRQNPDGTYDQGQKVATTGDYEEGDFYNNLPR